VKVAILGSTGSVGLNTVEVIKYLEEFEVYGLSVNSSVAALEKQIREVRPPVAVVYDEDAYRSLVKSNSVSGTEILCGKDGLIEMATAPDVDIVVNAASGMAGLAPMLEALRCGKKVAVANKESIVMGWHLIKDSIQYEGQLLPVDSEHSAVFQSIKGEDRKNIEKIILTASGGAVYDKSLEELDKIGPEECLKHPTWNMGRKITMDSATLMNKGLEVIEAHNLFDIDYSKIEVYVHPQSVVHGMVQYCDGSIIASLGPADMKLPIQYALTHPERKPVAVEKLKIENLNRLDFDLPDRDKFPCLDIAYKAGAEGGEKPVILCAADEAAVDAFCDGKISFSEIPRLIERALEKDIEGSLVSAGGIEALYNEAKRTAEGLVL